MKEIHFPYEELTKNIQNIQNIQNLHAEPFETTNLTSLMFDLYTCKSVVTQHLM